MTAVSWTAPQTLVTRANVGRARQLDRLGRRVYWSFALAATLLSAAPSVPVGVPMVLGGMAVGGYLSLWLASRVVEGASVSFGAAHLDGDTLHIQADGFSVSLHAGALREGHVRLGPLGWSLRVRDDRGVLYEVTAPDEQTATRWLEALGLDVSRRAVRIVSNRRLVQWAFAYFFGGFFAMPFWIAAMAVLALLGSNVFETGGMGVMYLFSLAGYWFAARAVGRVDVAVGADGVRISRAFGRRFLPVHTLTDVAVDGTTLIIAQRNGGPLRLRFAAVEDADAIARRIAQLIALQHAAPVALPAALASAQATTPEGWRDVFLHALRDEGYRAQAFTLEDLERIVGARGVTAPQRMGAALALRALAPDQGATGIRIAAEAMVDPAVARELAPVVAAETARRAQGLR